VSDPDEVAFVVGKAAQTRMIEALDRLRAAFAELDDAFEAYVDRREEEEDA
jgi:hypothetical protein